MTVAREVFSQKRLHGMERDALPSPMEKPRARKGETEIWFDDGF
jgi:hypothetical protein